MHLGMDHSDMGMPKGTWLGPLTFIVHLDDLNPPSAVHKYVDDTTITEILHDRHGRKREVFGQLVRN